MRNCLHGITGLILAFFLTGCAELDRLAKDLEPLMTAGPQQNAQTRIIAGLKEALAVGTSNAVVDLSRVDGYFQNAATKILIPREVRQAGDFLRRVGMGSLVDQFEHSLNTAAEKAAPQARSLFLGAIRDMTFADARRILQGADTAATDYLRSKTETKLASAFRPIITAAMNDVGVTRLYKQMHDSLNSLPFAPAMTVDLDSYVTDRALDGLFLTVAEEEKKIRTDPAARVTELLRDVFGHMRK